MPNKLLVIGLDGATFDLLDPLMAQGLLPNLARLKADGVSGRLASTVPPVSVPAWPSFATGRNPGKTGMYDFLVRKPQSYQLMPSPPLRVRAFWETVSQQGLRVGVVNVPGSYPPRPVNGFVVTGLMTPSTDVEFTYPPALKNRLNELTGGYKLDCERGWWEYADDADFVAEIDELIDQRFQVFNSLMTQEPWDFLCLVITETDRFHHRMWKHIDATHPERNPQFADCFARLYRRLDTGLGEILSRLDADTNVIIMSDHGFGPCRYSFSPLLWLMQEGYLKLKARLKDRTVLRYLNSERVSAWLQRVGLRGLVRRLVPQRARHAVINTIGHENPALDLHRLIDWSQTVAYPLPLSNAYGNLFLNIKGRDPEGVVEPGRQADHLLAEIRQKLERLTNPLSPTPLRVQTHRTADFYTPDSVLTPPDLVYSLDDYGFNIDNARSHGSVFERHDLGYHSASHRPEGILLAAGPAFKRGVRVNNANLIDLAPTCQYLLEVPLSSDLDGRVLEDSLVKDLGEVALRNDDDTIAEEVVYSDKDVAEIESRLKQLGYIE